MRDMNKCIRCRRCVRTCIDLQEVGVLEAVNRSDKHADRHLRGHAARRRRVHQLRPVRQPLPHRRPVRQGRDRRRVGRHRRPRRSTSSSRPRRRRAPAMGELFGLEPGTPVTFEMNTALRRAGFDKVFDTNFTADLTIIEEGTELIQRLYGALVERRQGRRPAAVHELLAGLGQVPRALLPRVPAQRLVRQEPAADVRRAHQDLLRREARRSTRRTS